MPNVRPLLLALSLGVAAASTAVATTIPMAITVDDLPVHGEAPPGESRLAIAEQILATLKQHHVPEVYGFVNGASLAKDKQSLAVLKDWVGAGYPLGNHTYSHMDLGLKPLGAFLADIKNDEPVLARFPAPPAKMFRFPYLGEGNSWNKRQGVRGFLRANGYETAQVSVDFADWAWNIPYTRCMVKQDQSTLKTLKTLYLSSADERLQYASELSRRLEGRQVPQIVLLHIGAFTALELNDLLTAYEHQGVYFIGLRAAMKDPVYREKPAILTKVGETFLEQLRRSRRVLAPKYPETPWKALAKACASTTMARS